MITRRLEFGVPLLPPSVNHYKRPRRLGGFYRGPEALSFVEAVCIFSHKERVPGEFYQVELTFVLPPEKQGLNSNDLDNFLKVALDAIGRAGVISNDGRIMDLAVHKRFCAENRDASTLYHITGIEANNEEERHSITGNRPRARTGYTPAG